MVIEEYFDLIWTREISEISTLALLYKHKVTGAEVLILENDDENKVFAANFRTLATNSTGVAHILEHSALGGSRKYPVREPFLELLKSSLQTFLNAFTFPDKTIYPVASQNTQDFYNLVDVYLDAVFYPRLSQLTFFQEGWHHEFNDKGELIYKGVVFNEMKGAYSNPDSILGDQIVYELFPDTEYRFDQGGDPLEIPKLTYADFVKFHQQHYHPSNARIFFYGNGDRAQHLQALQDYLKDFSAGEQTIIPNLQTEFSSARTVLASYPANAGSVAKAYTTVSWMIHGLQDPVDKLGMEVLQYMLLESDAAPLKNALLDSELGEDLTGLGYETDFRQQVFSTGLKGVKDEDMEKVEKLILETLYELVRDGIPADVVNGALNRVEFDYRESRAGNYPRGLIFLLKSLQTWMYDGDPLEGIFFAQRFQALRSRIQGGEKYFENLIKSQLLNNKHKLILRLLPDTAYIAKREESERQQLQSFSMTLPEGRKEEINKLAKELEEWQQAVEKPEDLAKLPVLRLTDVEPEARRIPQIAERLGPAQVLRHELNTGGIAYLAVGFELTHLPQELLPYMAVFNEALLRLGTTRQTYEEIATRIDLDTGGIEVHNHISPVLNEDLGRLFLFLDGKSTLPKVDKLLGLMRELLLEVNLDQQDKFKQVILEEKAKLESAMIRAGNAMAFNRVSAHYRQACLITEEISGIKYLHSLRHMLELVEHDWSHVHSQFKRLYELMLKEGKLVINFTADSHSWETVKGLVNKFVSDFPDNHERSLPPIRYELLKQNEGFIIPASVNFVAQAFDMTAAGYDVHGGVYLVQNLLNRDYMWNRVRVQGGAYGGFADYQIRVGVLMLASYRDPHVKQTLDVYHQTPNFLLNVALDPAELEKHIIGAIGRLDKYLEPDAKGWVAFDWYMSGMTQEARQHLRDQLLKASTAELRAFGEKFMHAMQSGGRIAILGEREKILQADEQLGLGLKTETLL